MGLAFPIRQKAQNLYVATTDSMNCISDRYDIYHFNGTDFVYQKTGAPFWLHPQLHHYQRLELFFRTKDYIIRIDNLDGETMRYASWKSTQQMSDTPELVLNGSYVEKDNTFLFSKGSYRYVVTMGDKATLKVQHNGKPSCNKLKKRKSSDTPAADFIKQTTGAGGTTCCSCPARPRWKNLHIR